MPANQPDVHKFGLMWRQMCDD